MGLRFGLMSSKSPSVPDRDSNRLARSWSQLSSRRNFGASAAQFLWSLVTLARLNRCANTTFRSLIVHRPVFGSTALPS